MVAKPKMKAVLAGTLLTVGLSTFVRFGYPFVPLPMLIGIALAARLGRSADWRVGVFNGAVIGFSGTLIRFAFQPSLVENPMQVALAVLVNVALYSVAGVGITRLFASGDSIMW